MFIHCCATFLSEWCGARKVINIKSTPSRQAHHHTGTPPIQGHHHNRHTITTGIPSQQAHHHNRHTITTGTPSQQAHHHNRHIITTGTTSQQTHHQNRHTIPDTPLQWVQNHKVNVRCELPHLAKTEPISLIRCSHSIICSNTPIEAPAHCGCTNLICCDHSRVSYLWQ